MNIIFIGPPGSGKGTQSDILSKSLNVKKLSTGDILRKAVKSATAIGREIKSVIEKGELISDEIMISMILNTLKIKEYKNGFILDGFPRTLNQAISLTKMFEDNNIVLDTVIELQVNEQLLIDRVSGRFSCDDCGTNYNSKFNTTQVDGICDVCGSKEFIYRKDDNIETLKYRIKKFYKEATKLIEYCKSLNLLYTVNGMQQMEEVTESINLILNR